MDTQRTKGIPKNGFGTCVIFKRMRFFPLFFMCFVFIIYFGATLFFFQFLQVASNRPHSLSLSLSLGKVFIWHCRSLLTATWHGANILSLSFFPLLHCDFTSLCVSWVCFVFVIFCFGFVFSALSLMHPHSYLDTFSCIDYSWAARQQRNGRPVVSSLQRTPHRTANERRRRRH